MLTGLSRGLKKRFISAFLRTAVCRPAQVHGPQRQKTAYAGIRHERFWVRV